MDVISHLSQNTIIELKAFNVDASVTNGVISLWAATLLIFGFYFIVSKKLRPIPGIMQNFAEVIIGFIRDDVAAMIPKNREKWVPFVIALFSFILVNNLLGLVPGMSSATGNINTTATLAVIVFLVVQATGVVNQGPGGYLKTLMPKDVPLPIAVLLIPIEIVSMLAKPFSLAVRLFANVFAGHAVMFMIISMIFIFKNYYIVPLPVIGNVVMLAFEIFISFIQAFIFTYLSTLYIATATAEH